MWKEEEEKKKKHENVRISIYHTCTASLTEAKVIEAQSSRREFKAHSDPLVNYFLPQGKIGLG